MPLPDVYEGPVYSSNRESPTKPLSTLSPQDVNEMERSAKSRGNSRATSTTTAAIERSKLGQEEAEEKAKYYKSVIYDQVEKYEHQLERYEDLQNLYKKAKETNAHTKTAWEKETRRLRKEAFRCQSMIVKLQEEVKTARNSIKPSEIELEQERQRARQREEEAFAAKYELVSVQAQLARTTERLELAQKERDALKMIIKGEEMIKTASDSPIPLPSSENVLDEAEKKEDDMSKRLEQAKDDQDIETTIVATSSAAEEGEELDQIRMEIEWERRSAKRAHDLVDFMKVECKFRCCSCHIEEIKPSCPEEVKDVGAQPPPLEPSALEANTSLLSLIEGPTTATEVDAPTISAGTDILAPTMSREEALEQIRQRRVRSIQI